MRLNEIFSDDFITKLNGLNDGANLDPEESDESEGKLCQRFSMSHGLGHVMQNN